MSGNRAYCRMSHSSTDRVVTENLTLQSAYCELWRYPFEGCIDLPLTFRYCTGEVLLLLRDVGPVQNLRYHFSFLESQQMTGKQRTARFNRV